jgi:hypothetical protein
MKGKDMRKKHLFTAISISFALLFWFSDSVVHYYGYGEHAFEVLPSDLNELWMRCAIVLLIVAFGVFADHRTGLEKVVVYRAMLGATNHILRNHLQNMLLFREEAENSKDFDKDVLKLYDQMIDKTVEQIRNLENIQEPSKANIEDRYRPK